MKSGWCKRNKAEKKLIEKYVVINEQGRERKAYE